jgi:hypothetical protein
LTREQERGADATLLGWRGGILAVKELGVQRNKVLTDNFRLQKIARGSNGSLREFTPPSTQRRLPKVD